jgi:hypothetical protein
LVATLSPTQGKKRCSEGAGSLPRWFGNGAMAQHEKLRSASPTAAYYPSWYTPRAKHGKTASSTGDMPSWDIVERAGMVTVYEYQIEVDKNNSMLLPKDVRKYLK